MKSCVSQAKDQLENWGHVQSWRNEIQDDTKQFRKSTKFDPIYDEVPKNQSVSYKVKQSGGYLDNAGRGSSTIKRISKSGLPYPSQGYNLETWLVSSLLWAEAKNLVSATQTVCKV